MKKNDIYGTMSFLSFFVSVSSLLFLLTAQAGLALPASVFTQSDISQHSARTDCWTAINGTVYDLSTYVSATPERETFINSLCGTDGTQMLANDANESDLLPVIGDLAVGTFMAAETTTTENNISAPTITILGDNPVTVTQGSNYADAGADVALHFAGSLVATMSTSNPVNTNVPGTYNVMYTVTDNNGENTTASRTVMVVGSSSSGNNSNVPLITIVGDNPATLNLGSAYNDAGANVEYHISTGNLIGNMVTTNNVNTNALGNYIVTYDASDSNGNSAQANRTVMVVSPSGGTGNGENITLTVLGDNPVTVTQGSTYTDDGATATDNFIGDLTSSIITTNPVDTSAIGNYTVMYSVNDSFGHSTQANRTVMVVAPSGTNNNAAPSITVLGNNPETVAIGNLYSDAGATATDTVDGDLTANITTSNPVDTSIVGNYTVMYTVTDSSGMTATADRTVMVI